MEMGPPKSSAKDLTSSGYSGKKAGETLSGGLRYPPNASVT